MLWLLWLPGCLPDLDGGTWVLGAPYPGLGVEVHEPGCRMVFALEAGLIDWLDTCGRTEELLPREAWAIGAEDQRQMYRVRQGDEVWHWVLHHGTHRRLYELWVFDHLVEDRTTFDSEMTLPLWALEDGDPREGIP